MTPLHRGVRNRWAREHSAWTLEQWRQVLFCDECRLCLVPDNHRRRVWREPGNIARLCHSIQRFQQGGGSLMFWAGIMYGRRTPLITIHGNLTSVQYRDRILEPTVRPYRQYLGDNFIFQDDNPRVHRSRLVNTFLQAEEINRIDWPSRSPDMNPIEHAWDQLKHAVRKHRNPPQTLDDLRRVAIEEWDRLEQNRLNDLVDSMPRRVRACANARGGVTKY